MERRDQGGEYQGAVIFASPAALRIEDGTWSGGCPVSAKQAVRERALVDPQET
jgi:hypothetical protein